ncbi:MAG: TrkH family potassium uptake protein [Mucinivorans sp.]
MKAIYILRYVGMVLLLNAAFMLLAAVVAYFNGVDTGLAPLLLSFIITGVVGTFPLIFVPADQHISSRDGYIIVIASWIASCVVGMLPYLIWGGEFSLINAWWESTSGFTTTGSTILNDVEALPRSLLFWRSSTHWIGGVGVVLFALVVLPAIGRQKMTLSSVEISSLAKDNFRYNTKKILKIILYVYVGLTAAETVLLNVVGMDWFDAVNYSFSTMATGGFATRNLSVMAYNNLGVEVVIMIFMFLAGIHLGIIYSSLRGVSKIHSTIWHNQVARYYLMTILVSGAIVSLYLFFEGFYPTLGKAIRYGLFQVISYNTTTGFASANNAFWPPLTMLILMVLSVQCAMAGSTTGGIKADRVLILIKAIKARVLKIQHPSAVMRVKLNGRTMDDQMVSGAILLIAFYVLSLVVSTLVLSAFDIDLLTSFSASVASLGNVGPGFGQASNLANMNFLPVPCKLWLSVMMIFGRLELFGLIHLFMMRSWK